MASITDVVKEGLKYPFNDGKKVLTFGVIFLISSIISLFMNYFIYDSLMVIESRAPLETYQALMGAIPPSNMALIVISWILTFIVMIFCVGYIYKVIQYGIDHKYELPGFNDIKGLFVNGLKMFIVGLAYSILPMILFFLGLMLAINQAVGPSVNAIGGIILLIALIFGIFMSLMEVMALGHMIAKDNFKAAFEFKEILALIKNIGWGRYIGILLFTIIVIMVLSVFLEFIFGGITVLLSMILSSAIVMAIVSIILQSLFLSPYISIVIARIYGAIYREAKGVEAEAPKAEFESAAEL